MKVWSRSNDLSFSVRRVTNDCANDVHDTGLATGSSPNWPSAGTSSSSSSGVTTNASALPSGSDRRSCPPCVNVIDSKSSLGGSSLGAARRSWPDSPTSNTRSSPVSSACTSSEPRRSTLRIFAPSRRAWNTLRVPLRWVALGTGTSTDFTRPPTVSRSRPRRTVSISGSSGMVALQLGHQRGVGVAGGDLFGLLLRPPVARPPRHAGDGDGHVESTGVVRSLGEGLVARRIVEVAGGQLLQPALVVLTAGAAGVGLGDPGTEQPQHQVVRLFGAGRNVDRAEHGFEGVGEDGRLLPAARLLLTLAEQQGVVDVDAEASGQLVEVRNGKRDLRSLKVARGRSRRRHAPT